jgi:N-acetylglucosaminyldiphosphoundecaprenol N-acetyl-beta-D-mannosaminyltransferase
MEIRVRSHCKEGIVLSGKPRAKPAENVSIMGVPFSKMTFEETIRHIAEIAESPKEGVYHIVTANPEVVMAAKKDEQLMKVLQDASLITPDGIGIVLASRWKGDPLPERVAGYDMLIKLLETGNDRRWSFYFLGTDEETSRTAVQTISSRYPNLRVAGRHNGFFSAEEEPRIIEEIRHAAPDFLIVAMGAVAAAKWIDRHISRLNAKVAFGVGGSLDVIAGKVQRAPLIWQKLNLEWLHRLLKQPSRWRRQLVLPVFAFQAFFRRNRL